MVGICFRYHTPFLYLLSSGRLGTAPGLSSPAVLITLKYNTRRHTLPPPWIPVNTYPFLNSGNILSVCVSPEFPFMHSVTTLLQPHFVCVCESPEFPFMHSRHHSTAAPLHFESPPFLHHSSPAPTPSPFGCGPVHHHSMTSDQFLLEIHWFWIMTLWRWWWCQLVFYYLCFCSWVSISNSRHCKDPNFL